VPLRSGSVTPRKIVGSRTVSKLTKSVSGLINPPALSERPAGPSRSIRFGSQPLPSRDRSNRRCHRE
jgi:hypothetical protein